MVNGGWVCGGSRDHVTGCWSVYLVLPDAKEAGLQCTLYSNIGLGLGIPWLRRRWSQYHSQEMSAAHVEPVLIFIEAFTSKSSFGMKAFFKNMFILCF